jgi:uncharacterized hydantoinase/oxoprolinase family protein
MTLVDDPSVLEWLSSRTGSRVKTLREAQTGVAISRFLCQFAESPKSLALIQRGSTLEERKSNYQLIQKFFGVLKFDFHYDVDALADYNRAEFFSLVNDLSAFVEENEIHADTTDDTDGFGDDLEALISELESNLATKLEDLTESQAELKDLAIERDFYFSKLLRMEKVCKKYSPNDYEHVVKILSLTSPEFAPVDASQ